MTSQGRDLAREDELLRIAVVRLRSRVLAMVFAMLGGTSLFVATAWLLVRGGANVGQHLGLLNNFLPGYSVTWPGAFLGFFYGALVGGLLGWSVAQIYNRVSEYRGVTN
ncbi:MAG TPA: hypothetical protein ENO23_09845, partial [Alphaproteobacteria bacterium]|nr:hypothetical protein [Alphaproteobacteria bacterium]